MKFTGNKTPQVKKLINDIIAISSEKNIVFLIEAVHSAGPILPMLPTI